MIGELIPTGVTFGVGRNSLNDAFSGTAEFNNIALDFGGNFSAGTGGGIILSAGTDLYDIFGNVGSGIYLSLTGGSMTSGATIITDNGNAQLTLDYLGTPNEAGLFSDKNSLDSSYVYVGSAGAVLLGTNQTEIKTSGSTVIQLSEGSKKIEIYADSHLRLITSGSSIVLSENTNYDVNSFSAKTDSLTLGTDVTSGGEIHFADNSLSSIGIGGVATRPIFLGSINSVIQSGTSSSTILASGNSTIGSNNARSAIIGSTNVFINNNLGDVVVLGHQNFTATTSDTTYVNYLNINSLNTGTSINNLGIDSSGNVVTGVVGGSGGGVESYVTLATTGGTITWNVSGDSANYEVTISANTTLNLTNVRNGEYGTIIVKQDTIGSRTVTFGTVNGGASTHKVLGGGAGSPALTATANAYDILSFTYNGTYMFWSVGNDYT